MFIVTEYAVLKNLRDSRRRKKVFERNDIFGKKASVNINNNKNINMNKYHNSSDFISLS